MPAVVVRLLATSSVARGRLELLCGVLQSLLNGWKVASTIGARNSTFGCTGGRLRWGEVSAALRIDWRVPASFWLLGECVWMLRRAGGGLEKRIGRGLIFWQKMC